MVSREVPENESLRIELQEALVSYRHWTSQLTQVTGFLVTADVLLLSYGFSQKLAAILLVASGVPILILMMYQVVGLIASPLVNLILRIERRLLIRKDSLGATFARTYFGRMTPVLDRPIEDLTDEELRHVTFKWESLWSTIPIVLYAGTVIQVGLFVLSLTVFHYRFM